MSHTSGLPLLYAVSIGQHERLESWLLLFHSGLAQIILATCSSKWPKIYLSGIGSDEACTNCGSELTKGGLGRAHSKLHD